MIYAFTLVDDQGQTQFGLVTAEEPHLAHVYIEDGFPDHTELELMYDPEEVLNSQYNCLALLNTV